MGVLDNYAAQGPKKPTSAARSGLYQAGKAPGAGVKAPAAKPSTAGLLYNSGNAPGAGVRSTAASRGIAPRSTPKVGSAGLGTSPTGAVSGFAADTGGGAFASEAAPAAPRMTDEEFLAQDAEFNDTKTNSETEYNNLIAQLAKQKTDYELDNDNTMRNLGWNDPDGFNGAGGGSWNQNDKLTGYGQAFQNQLGDFSSRGMLDSSLYGGALNDLNRGFEQQRGDLATGRQNFNSGQATDIAQAGTSRDQAVTSAQRQALQRMAAQLGL